MHAVASCQHVPPAAGIVLARDGGALGKMLPVFNLFAGGPLGSGRQWCSWIHRCRPAAVRSVHACTEGSTPRSPWVMHDMRPWMSTDSLGHVEHHHVCMGASQN